MQDKLVITGIGIYSPIGKNKEEVYNSLINSSSGISIIDEFNTSDLRNNKGGVIKDIIFNEDSKQLRSDALAQIAVEQAIADSNILYLDHNKERIGISVGTCIGGYGGFVDYLCDKESTKPTSSKVNLESKLNPNRNKSFSSIIDDLSFSSIGFRIAKKYGLCGPVSSSLTACSAGANAIVMARDLILSNHCDAMIIIGVDPISQLTCIGFNSLMAMTKGELKVMDENRSGLLIGEGAACIVLEKESSALKRNAHVYAVLSGSGVTNDAYHCTRPHPEALGAILAIKNALLEANLSPNDIDYINLHGTGTKHNDIMEIKAIKHIFGNDGNVPVSSSKSMMGHTLGAAGTIESVICLISLIHQIVPPNINFSQKINGYNYDISDKVRFDRTLRHVMSNSFGFGGNCASLIFSSY